MPSVVQVSTKCAVDVSAGVCTLPLMLVLLAFAAVKSGSSGLDITHAFILVVTHPIADVPPEATELGTDASTISGFKILIEH